MSKSLKISMKDALTNAHEFNFVIDSLTLGEEASDTATAQKEIEAANTVEDTWWEREEKEKVAREDAEKRARDLAITGGGGGAAAEPFALEPYKARDLDYGPNGTDYLSKQLRLKGFTHMNRRSLHPNRFGTWHLMGGGNPIYTYPKNTAKYDTLIIELPKWFCQAQNTSKSVEIEFIQVFHRDQEKEVKTKLVPELDEEGKPVYDVETIEEIILDMDAEAEAEAELSQTMMLPELNEDGTPKTQTITKTVKGPVFNEEGNIQMDLTTTIEDETVRETTIMDVEEEILDGPSGSATDFTYKTVQQTVPKRTHTITQNYQEQTIQETIPMMKRKMIKRVFRRKIRKMKEEISEVDVPYTMLPCSCHSDLVQVDQCADSCLGCTNQMYSFPKKYVIGNSVDRFYMWFRDMAGKIVDVDPYKTHLIVELILRW